ncbi:MAG: PD-(D/E)XK nuclease family protein [Melioribacteraceae bacterium]|nr:MAG: PD-(D/E)XK nuclease family protein [Melioribacteraceae bacterium]
MSRLFLDTAGITGEDLTTELLKIILTDKKYSPFQKLFYNRFLQKTEFKSTEDFLFEVESQNVFEEGRPDLLIYNDEEVYCLENKFYADFSSKDQLIRYHTLLQNNDSFKKCSIKKVYLLTIEKRKKYYEYLIDSLLDSGSREDKKFSDLFEFIFWEDILELWKSDDCIINALQEYIYDLYIKEINFSSEEIMLLKDQNVPELLDKFYKLISQVRDEITKRGFVATSIRSSYKWWGFYIDLNKVKVWFGFGTDLWKMSDDFISPIGIQIQKSSVSNSMAADKIRNELEPLNFNIHSQLYWIKRYPLKEDELNAGHLADMLEVDLRTIYGIFN